MKAVEYPIKATPEETKEVNAEHVATSGEPKVDFFDDWDAAFGSDNDTPAPTPAAPKAPAEK